MKNIKLTILFIWLAIYSVSAQINDVITFSINDIEIDSDGVTPCSAVNMRKQGNF